MINWLVNKVFDRFLVLFEIVVQESDGKYKPEIMMGSFEDSINREKIKRYIFNLIDKNVNHKIEDINEKIDDVCTSIEDIKKTNFEPKIKSAVYEYFVDPSNKEFVENCMRWAMQAALINNKDLLCSNEIIQTVIDEINKRQIKWK